jgi:hypothetical protein
MSNISITTNSPQGIVIWEPVYEDDTFTAPGAETWAAGTVLGRITASGKLTKYTSGAADGSENPVAVLQDALEFTGAGDLPGRPIISGRVRRQDLVAHGVGPLTIEEVDALRNYGIIALNTTQLAEFDNQ